MFKAPLSVQAAGVAGGAGEHRVVRHRAHADRGVGGVVVGVRVGPHRHVDGAGGAEHGGLGDGAEVGAGAGAGGRRSAEVGVRDVVDDGGADAGGPGHRAGEVGGAQRRATGEAVLLVGVGVVGGATGDGVVDVGVVVRVRVGPRGDGEQPGVAQ